jgi:hypothetical protein
MNAATLSGPSGSSSMTPAMRASRVLGWVSFALGAAELLAPKRVARAAGINEDRTGLIRAYGAREIVSGVGAHSVNPVPALWSRVAGDAIDLATIVALSRGNGNGRNRNAWIAIGVVAGITLLDAVVAAKLSAERQEGKGEVRDYSDRSGFPGGADAARGAGIVTEAFAGKAGGAAAGDTSPAGDSPGGRTVTDLGGAAQPDQRPAGQGGTSNTDASRDSSEKSLADLMRGQDGLSDETRKPIPAPVGYTPA